MYKCTHESDDGTARIFSESQCSVPPDAILGQIGTQQEPQPDIHSANLLDSSLPVQEFDCEGGICSLNWTPGTRH
ncbi:hypothetical protein KF707_15415 [Candidatus Obscuribacterales bacterium]|jgi:hypothetical protein|nr:hypothetical protein [Candidatus Obscuribacterales bacterium]